MFKNMLESVLNFTNWMGTLISNIKPHNYENMSIFKDLPTNTQDEWINKQNAKLNLIPISKPRPKE